MLFFHFYVTYYYVDVYFEYKINVYKCLYDSADWRAGSRTVRRCDCVAVGGRLVAVRVRGPARRAEHVLARQRRRVHRLSLRHVRLQPGGAAARPQTLGAVRAARQRLHVPDATALRGVDRLQRGERTAARPEETPPV